MSLLARGLSRAPLLSNGRVKSFSVRAAANYSISFSNIKLDVQRSSFHSQPRICRKEDAGGVPPRTGGSAGRSAQEASDIKIPSQDEVTKILAQLSKRPENVVERTAAQLLAYAVYNKNVEEVRQDAINLVTSLRENIQLGELLLERDVNRVEATLQQVKQALQLQSLTVSFLEHLYDSEMMKQVEEVFSSVLALLKDYNNEQEVHITIPKELKGDEKEKTLKNLQFEIERSSLRDQFLKSGVIKPINFRFNYTVDPSIVGGYILESEDWIEDRSTKSVLARREQAIQDYLAVQVPRPRIEEVDELVLESPQPHPELKRREDKLKNLQELKNVLELKPDALKKLKNPEVKRELEAVLAEVSGWPGSKVPPNLDEFAKESPKSELQSKAREYVHAVDQVANYDKAELERLKANNYFGTLPPIQPIMNDLRRNYIQLETTKSADEKARLQKAIDDTLKTLSSRTQANLEMDMLLYSYKVNSWKFKLIVDLAEGSAVYRATQKAIQDCESKVSKTEYKLPDIPQVKFAFPNLKKLSPQDLLNVPTRYLLKLSYKQKEQLPLDEVKKMIAPYVDPPVDVEKVRKLNISELDPVAADVVSLDVRTDLQNFVFKRNSLLHLNLTANIDTFDKPLDNLLKGDVKPVSEQELASVPDKWLELETQLRQASLRADKDVNTLAEQMKSVFTQYVQVQLYEDIPKDKWSQVREVNDKILALRALDQDINQKVKALGRQPLPYPATY